MGALLEADVLIAAARDATGLDDFGDDRWREGLDRLVAALCDEAALNDRGVVAAAGDVLSYLTTRLRVVDWHRRHTDLARADVTPPIVIVGQARTGTTILFDLLAQDPANRVPLTWEVDHPIPPPETATYDCDPRIAEAQAQLDLVDLAIPGFKAMHPMGARLGQECVRITGGDFRSMIFPTQYHVPSYARWLLDEADMRPAYRWHRRVLQVLQSRHHAARWVLKSPGHIWCLEALLAEYPGALLIQTHRDPLRVVASIASLLTTLRRLASDATTLPAAAAEFADYLLDGFDRSVTARERGILGADRVIDVQFRPFVADPVATVRTAYERFGMEMTPTVEARMRAFLTTNPQEKHGGHRYAFAGTGLDAGMLRERARRYQEYFDVPSEE
jgi:hypothetical protein